LIKKLLIFCLDVKTIRNLKNCRAYFDQASYIPVLNHQKQVSKNVRKYQLKIADLDMLN